MKLCRGYEYLTGNRSLKILRVQTFHSGVYRCRSTRLVGGENCSDLRYFSDNATVTVNGMSYSITAWNIAGVYTSMLPT